MSLYYYVNNETTTKESINNHIKIFNEYIFKTPTLKEALMQMFNSSGANSFKTSNLINEILTIITTHLNMKYKEIKKNIQK